MTPPVRRYFDRAGATYESVALVQRHVAAHLSSLCPASLAGNVLEIGAGSGLLTRLLTPRHTAGIYVALDIAPGMLAHAAMPQAGKLAADGERAPFVPACFDFLASASAMHWYGNPTRSIPANLALLRPGAGFALALYVEGTLGELREASRATGFGSIYPMHPTGFYTALFASLPHIDWKVSETTHTVHHASVPGMLRALKDAGVTHSPARSPGSPARYREFTRYYAAHFGDASGVCVSYTVCYLTGRLRAVP